MAPVGYRVVTGELFVDLAEPPGQRGDIGQVPAVGDAQGLDDVRQPIHGGHRRAQVRDQDMAVDQPVEISGNGNVYLAYNRDRSATSGNPNDALLPDTDIMLARQTGGQRLR